jgi:putative RNA 2'-phosphotransferase
VRGLAQVLAGVLCAPKATMTPERHKRISKLLSLMLRHEPEKFRITLDAQGFAPFEDVARALADKTGASAAEIRQVVRESDKQRFEIEDLDSATKIRARYGHSVEGEVEYEPIEPPEILFHGTSRAAIDAIRVEGLRAMNRQKVHLSSDKQMALIVGRRHDARPILLSVRAGEAHRAGVKFYSPQERVFLADAIEARWIDFPND